MPRWDITDPDRVHNSDIRGPAEQQQRDWESVSQSVGRGGSGESSNEGPDRTQRTLRGGGRAARERRSLYQSRGRSYTLRSSEREAMIDIGRFRAVDVKDLARFVYEGDENRMKYDLENLRSQELIEEKVLFRAHKAARKMVALTAEGHRLVQKTGGLQEGQRIYHGFTKPRELDHDADLYKVYQKAAKEIAEQGGRVVRVRLDSELKESINRAKEAAGRLPSEMRERWLAAAAEEHGLAIQGTAIHLPDVQLEYETADGRFERENLELLSRNYREEGLRTKATAGFKIYARAGESNRIRRALQDTGLVRQVLFI